MGQKMKPPAQRTRYGLCFKMMIECGSLTPYFIPTNLYQTRAKHNAKNQPTEQADDREWRFMFGKRAHIKQRAEENRKKTGFCKLDLPSVSIPLLPYMHKRHIQKPEYCKQWGICVDCHYHTGKH